MHLRNPNYMQTEENWLQKPLHYTVLKFLQCFKHFQSCNSNKDQGKFYKGTDGNSTGFNILYNSNCSSVIHPIPPNLSMHYEIEMYTIPPKLVLRPHSNQLPYL